MSHLRPLPVLLLLMMAMLSGHAAAAEEAGKSYTFEGVIASIAADRSFVITSVGAKNPKTATVKVDDQTVVTIDKKPAAFADLVAGDKAWTLFTGGVAKKIAVTRGETPAGK